MFSRREDIHIPKARRGAMAAVQQQGDGEDEDKDKDQNAAEINVDNPAGEVYQDRAGRFVAPRTKEIAMRWRFLRPARRGKRIFLSKKLLLHLPFRLEGDIISSENGSKMVRGGGVRPCEASFSRERKTSCRPTISNFCNLESASTESRRTFQSSVSFLSRSLHLILPLWDLVPFSQHPASSSSASVLRVARGQSSQGRREGFQSAAALTASWRAAMYQAMLHLRDGPPSSV